MKLWPGPLKHPETLISTKMKFCLLVISEKLVRLYLNCPTLLPERTEAGELKTEPRIWKYFKKIHTEIGKPEKSRLVEKNYPLNTCHLSRWAIRGRLLSVRMYVCPTVTNTRKKITRNKFICQEPFDLGSPNLVCCKSWIKLKVIGPRSRSLCWKTWFSYSLKNSH